MLGGSFVDSGSFWNDIISEDLLNLGPRVLPGEGGFGPGDYSGGYTGEGDAIYWGPSGPDAQQAGPGGQAPPGPGIVIGAATVKSGFGPGYVVGDAAQGIAINTEANSEGLGTSSQASAPVDYGDAGDVEGLEGKAPDPGDLVDIDPTPGGDAAPDPFTGQVGSEYSFPSTSATAETGTEGTMGQPPAVEMQQLGTETVSSGVDSGTAGTLTETEGTMGTPYQGAIELSTLEPSFIDSEPSSAWAQELPELPDWRGTFRPGMKPGFEEPSDLVRGGLRGDTPGGIRPFKSPGQAIELVPMGEDAAAPMLLDDVPLDEPAGNNFDMGKLEWNKLPKAELEALSDVISDPANISMGPEGIGWNPMSFTGFLKARVMDLAIGSVLMPLFNWIDDVSDTPWVSRGIQATLATIGLIVGGDPFGVVAAPVAWGVQEYMRQRQRLIENDDPEQYQGKKFGYVREGGKWYPAILTSLMRDEGWVGSNHSEVRFAYGTDLKWKKEKGTDTWVPYFADGTYHMKDFHVWDSEVDDPENEGSKEYGERVDPLRDFYMLTEDETTEMLQGMAGGDTFTGKDKVYTEEEQAAIQAAQKAAYEKFGVRDQVSWKDTWKQADKDHPAPNKYAQQDYYGQWGGYVDTLDDLRQSMDFMQDYRYSDEGQMQTSNFGENEFEGSRALRDAVNSAGYLGHPQWEDALEGGYYDQGSRPKGWDSLMTQGMGEGYKDNPEMLVLTDAYVTAMNDLYASQKVAGTAMGYNDLYGKSAPEGWLPAFHEGDDRQDPGSAFGQKYDFPLLGSASVGPDYVDPQKGSTNASRATKDNGWALYQDNSWKFGPLDTAEQLHEAISLIEESGDSAYSGTMHYRNSEQRSYLAQKAYTRYLYQKVELLGGLPYLNSETDADEALGKLPRDHDTGRVQYSDLTKIEWGRNPMYSELDDHGDSWTTYVPPGRAFTTLSESSTFSRFGDGKVDWEYVLKDAGILSDDPTLDPDYVAGRFQSVADYNTYLDPTEHYFFDEVRGTYILPGEQDPSTTWNPVTERYEAPEGLQPIEEGPEDAQEDAGPDGPDAVDEADFFGGWTTTSSGKPAEGFEGPQIPEGYTVDDDGNLVYTPEVDADAAAGVKEEGGNVGYDLPYLQWIEQHPDEYGYEQAVALRDTLQDQLLFAEYGSPGPVPLQGLQAADAWLDAIIGGYDAALGDSTGTVQDDTRQEVQDWAPHEDTYVPGPGSVPDHPDDHSDTEYEPRPVYHMDEYHAHDPTPAPTHVPQNIKVI